MNKKLAIIGSVGIPANYGGFETLVEYLTKYISANINTTVYCSSPKFKNAKQKEHNHARLIYIPLNANGIQSIPYDIISIIHALFYAQVLLVLGVAGSFTFPFIRLFTRKRILVNIDGLEHTREKWNYIARKYLKLSERIAVKYAHAVIADNKAIQEYVFNEYGKTAVMIPYGGDHITLEELTPETKNTYGLPDVYAFKVCRIEPENSIHIILEAFKNSTHHLVMVGNWEYSTYGTELYNIYSELPNYHLLRPIYNQQLLNQIRCNCSFYVHGHSAGGTNPSLVEAMFLKKPIVAFNVNYNRFTTNGYALYFSNESELKTILERSLFYTTMNKNMEAMHQFAIDNYQWSNIAEKYKQVIEDH